VIPDPPLPGEDGVPPLAPLAPPAPPGSPRAARQRAADERATAEDDEAKKIFFGDSAAAELLGSAWEHRRRAITWLLAGLAMIRNALAALIALVRRAEHAIVLAALREHRGWTRILGHPDRIGRALASDLAPNAPPRPSGFVTPTTSAG
jgi:hypothetical protein